MLPPGTRIGPYEIVGSLGAGGMGEVYRAKDARLGREVAIKALPADVAQDNERRIRFEREAQLLASLKHPNIATIHGLEEAGGAKYLVLELVEGRTLSGLLAGGALPVEEAIALATQIAEALAAAHEKGIIHRDLKPGNVMVTPEGQVKVLDFGLGKSLDAEASRSGEPAGSTAHSPTMTMAATQMGFILGTAGYMSPEQAKGRPADRRSDVWGFGCLLYEMLAGKRAFDGEDVTEILAHVVRGEPDWQALPASVPAAIRTLTERCLIKDRAQRLSDMSVVRFLLQERSSLISTPAAQELPASERRSIGWPVALGLVALAVVATASVLRLWSPRSTDEPPGRVSRLSITLPDDDELAGTNMRPLAIAPDGGSVVYVGKRGDGVPQLYVRKLDAVEPSALPGTETARSPFFSPDGRWIGFFARAKLMKVTVGGTALQTVADAPDARGGCWGTDDTIYFAPLNVSGIMKVSASGGAVTALSKPDRAAGEVSHRWPHVLADNRTILYTIWTGPGTDERQIVAQSLASGDRKVILRGGDGAQYIAPDYLLYGRLDGLFAMPWRPGEADLGGVVPVTLPETPRLENEGVSDYAISANGTMAYLAGGPERIARRIVWVDRAGNTEALSLPERDYEAVAISPDGRQAAVQIQDSAIGIWLYDFSRQTLSPFVTSGGSSQAPVWTPDGSHIIYRGTRKGHRNLYWKPSDGTGAEEQLTTKEDVVQTPTSVSPDGRFLIFTEGGGQALTENMIWVLRLDGDRTPRPLSEKSCLNAHVSPDGRWMAFQSFESGRSEIYVQPFPGPGPRRQISVGGGEAPRWSHDGRELFYAASDKFMAVDVSHGSGFSAGTPGLLYQGRYRASLNANTAYDVSPDGRHFLRVRQAQPERAVTRIDVVLNWFTELRAIAAGGPPTK